MSQEDYSGYLVAYEQEELQFPVYICILIGLGFIAASFYVGTVLLFLLGVAALGYAYYNFPLLETGRPRVGAGQYGLFVEGLGIIAWNAVSEIVLAPDPSRGVTHNEMHVKLSQPLPRALIADWRQRPVHRHLMRLPWLMTEKDIIRVPLDIMDHAPDEIVHQFSRMLHFYTRW